MIGFEIVRSTVIGRGGPPQYARIGGDLTTADSSNILICSTEFGWIWVIPLRGDRVSIGVVLAGHNQGGNSSHTIRKYYDLVRSCAELKPIMSNLAPVRNESIHYVRDWSYRCSQFTAPGLFLAGDAACFVDPILSTGLHLALRAGISAACATNSILNGQNVDLIQHWYNVTYAAAYEQYENMAVWWYHGDKHRDYWFDRSRQLVKCDQYGNPLSERPSFIYLASGMDGSNYVETSSDGWGHPLRMVALFHKHASFGASLDRLREKLGSITSPSWDSATSEAKAAQSASDPTECPRIRREAILSMVAEPERAQVRLYWEAGSSDGMRIDITDWEVFLRRCDGTRTLAQIAKDLRLDESEQVGLHNLASELQELGLLDRVSPIAAGSPRSVG